MERKKIFVSAYACEPDKGSEIGVGWHWILEMSKQFDLWVLTRANNKSNIENWIKKHPQFEQIYFVYYDLPKSLSFFKRGRKGVRLYYTLWQKFSNRIVKQVMQKHDIKIYHLLTYGNALWPASAYGIKQFFIWGPTGGTDTIPLDYFKHYGIKGKAIEIIRHMAVKTLPVNYGFKKRVKNADIILCKSAYMYRNIPEKYREKAVIFTDVAVDKDGNNEQTRAHTQNKEIKYFAAGKLDAWRGFDVLIEAFAKANVQNAKLEIAGSGLDKKRLQKLIVKYNVSKNISLPGHLTKDEYAKKMTDADVIVNPALKEGGVTVAFDAIKYGKPLICVDTGGYTGCFDNDSAVILERKTRTELIDALAEKINELSHEEKQKHIRENEKRIQNSITWEEKGKKTGELIEKTWLDKRETKWE